jgi:hypothetical protein
MTTALFPPKVDNVIQESFAVRSLDPLSKSWTGRGSRSGPRSISKYNVRRFALHNICVALEHSECWFQADVGNGTEIAQDQTFHMEKNSSLVGSPCKLHIVKVCGGGGGAGGGGGVKGQGGKFDL